MADAEDPVRLFEPHSDAPGELRALFDDARKDFPSEARLAAIQARLPREPLAPQPAPAVANPATGKLLLAAIGLGLVGAGIWLMSRSEPAPPEERPATIPPASISTAPQPLPRPELSANQPPPSEAAPSASAAPVPAAKPPAAPPARPGNEAALLERARRALGSDPNLALSLARRHEKEFPNGSLRQEREVIAIEALRRLGRANEATDRAQDFQNEFPNSAHGRSVERGRSK